ncbi:MAG: hypothetical protein ACFFCS_28270, partial [Candidatus Hodarchaeota archaeon]
MEEEERRLLKELENIKEKIDRWFRGLLSILIIAGFSLYYAIVDITYTLDLNPIMGINRVALFVLLSFVGLIIWYLTPKIRDMREYNRQLKQVQEKEIRYEIIVGSCEKELNVILKKLKAEEGKKKEGYKDKVRELRELKKKKVLSSISTFGNTCGCIFLIIGVPILVFAVIITLTLLGASYILPILAIIGGFFGGIMLLILIG